MKKRILAIAVVMICLSVLASTTWAYFTDQAVARNVITTAGVDIAIEEWQQTPDGLVPYPEEAIAVMPATEVSKIVTVRNLEAESFIRVRLEQTLLDADGKEMEIAPETLREIIHLTMNTENWTEKDGWWYYGSAVGTGAVTEPLMTAVSFDGPNMTNEYQSCKVTIDVFAQAVQVVHNEVSALDALGWPAEAEE